MAHFAKLNPTANADGTHDVIDVFPMNDSVNETELSTQTGGLWKKTSYNTRNGKYYTPNTTTEDPDQSKAFRKNFAGKAKVYDPVEDAFYFKKPYPSFTYNSEIADWDPPIPMPQTQDADDSGEQYTWDEDAYQADNTQGWVKVTD